jgi:predicted enzyme related to lactoylglutathione lyase
MAEHGTFIWNELISPDPEKSGAFYTELLDWTLQHADMGDAGTYTLFQNGGHNVAGLMAPPPGAPEGEARWHGYIAVDNLDAALARVPALGGTVLMPAKDIPDVGRICVIADPVGAMVSLMQPADPAW